MRDVGVQRHRTAMTRYSLSRPVALALGHGLISQKTSVLDYGCGQGDDVRALLSAGIEAKGWDPYFAPDQELAEVDIVNLGFVLNVIEDHVERKATLTRAWGLTKNVLLVSVMVVGAAPIEGLKPFADGYLTARGTFQKYYEQAELKAMLVDAVDVDPIALAPGIFALFRSPEDEQDFLLERRRGRTFGVVTASRVNTTPSAAKPALADRILEAMESIANFAYRHGRNPQSDELPERARDLLSGQRISFVRALHAATENLVDATIFEKSAAQRREDLILHQALNLLNRSQSSARYSVSTVRDIRHHFGGARNLEEQAVVYLKALADPKVTASAMRDAANGGVGAMDEYGRLVVDSGRLLELNGLLRCYLGCAGYLFGEFGDNRIIRLDPFRRRVTLFHTKSRRTPFPEIDGSVEIDLRRQEVVLRDDVRVLVRKADVLGFSPRSKQRRIEAERRNHEGYSLEQVLIRSK